MTPQEQSELEELEFRVSQLNPPMAGESFITTYHKFLDLYQVSIDILKLLLREKYK